MNAHYALQPAPRRPTGRPTGRFSTGRPTGRFSTGRPTGRFSIGRSIGRPVGRLLAAALLAAAGPMAADAHDGHAQGHGQAARAPSPMTARNLDANLVDQDGRTVNLRRDVIGDKVVVVDFVYTECTTVCPVASAMFAELQKHLGAAAAHRVQLVTITVDPVRDTPARLKQVASRFQAGPGWTWLTGQPAVVTEVLKGLGAYTPDFTQHPQLTLVGDGRTGRWTRFSGAPEPKRLLEHVNGLRPGPGSGA